MCTFNRAFSTSDTINQHLRVCCIFTMVFKGRIPAENRAYARYLRSMGELSLREIAKKCKMSLSSVKRCTELDLHGSTDRNRATTSLAGHIRNISVGRAVITGARRYATRRGREGKREKKSISNSI